MEDFHGFFKGVMLVFRLITGFWGGKMNKNCQKMQEIAKKCYVLNKNAQKIAHFCALLNIFAHFCAPG